MGLRIREWVGLGRATAILAAVYVASQAMIAHVLGPTGKDLAALQFTYDLAGFKSILARWTAADQARFLAHFPYDTVHPLIYATALAFGIASALRQANNPRWDALIGLPYLAALCDLAENEFYKQFFFAWQTDPNGPELARLFVMANGFCTGKWAIVAACLLLLAATWMLALINRARSRSL